MTAEKPQPQDRVKPGQTWLHQGKLGEPYTVEAVLPNATGYERTGQIGEPIIVYTQGYDGGYPKGTRWARSLTDFLGATEVSGLTVPNFILKEES